MEEIWKPVVGYESRYEISNLGRVKSIKILKPVTREITKNYKSISIRLSKSCKTKEFVLARIIAQAFIPNPENKQQVNHIDNNPLNNNINNLEWVSAKENQQHSIRNGRKNISPKNIKLHFIDIINIRNNKTLTINELSKKYNVNRKTISDVVQNKSWKLK